MKVSKQAYERRLAQIRSGVAERDPSVFGPPVHVFSSPRPGKGNVKVTLQECNGVQYVSFRLWYFDPSSGQERPSKEGVHLKASEAVHALKLISDACQGLPPAAPSAPARP